jgi:hypothetical protein
VGGGIRKSDRGAKNDQSVENDACVEMWQLIYAKKNNNESS